MKDINDYNALHIVECRQRAKRQNAKLAAMRGGAVFFGLIAVGCLLALASINLV